LLGPLNLTAVMRGRSWFPESDWAGPAWSGLPGARYLKISCRAYSSKNH